MNNQEKLTWLIGSVILILALLLFIYGLSNISEIENKKCPNLEHEGSYFLYQKRPFNIDAILCYYDKDGVNIRRKLE